MATQPDARGVSPLRGQGISRSPGDVNEREEADSRRRSGVSAAARGRWRKLKAHQAELRRAPVGYDDKLATEPYNPFLHVARLLEWLGTRVRCRNRN
jgi:hypothetical protein